MRKNPIKAYLLSIMMGLSVAMPAEACTGITLRTVDGKAVVARTIEWGGSVLKSQYVVVPQGHQHQSYTPDGIQGKTFQARYGYVGLSVEQKEFVAEGINETGLSAGLFYFPGYGKYQDYDAGKKEQSLSDFQLVSWILASFSTIDEVKEAMKEIRVIGIDPRASTVHWRIAEPGGRQVVLEIVDGIPHFYENTLGVLTNSPGFEWQMTNLNNYVNLVPGTAESNSLGHVTLYSFGAGSSMLGLPGDVTPPSRFVRAAFYQETAPKQETTEGAVLQAFQILNNFDIPIGVEHQKGTPVIEGLPSATQWTTATDPNTRCIYYRTAWNSMIRCIDLKTIDFKKVKYQAYSLDKDVVQPIEQIKIK